MPPTPPTPHPLATVAQIVRTPSAADGVPSQLEADLRTVGCMMIQEAGVMMELPQSTIATATVIFHRFFYVSSMLSFSISDISVSALYLATKLDENPVRLRDLINTYMLLQGRVRHLLSRGPEASLDPLRVGGALGKDKDEAVWAGFSFTIPSFHSSVFWEWKEAIQYNELQLLKRLGFNMQVDLPYSHVINYLKILDLVFVDDIAQLAWSILNDALLTPLYAQQPTHVLAVAAILLATRLRSIALPDGWYILFDVTWDDIWPCCGTIMLLYREWGLGAPAGVVVEISDEEKKRYQDRWRRAWILADSRKAVRKWVSERDGKGTAEGSTSREATVPTNVA